MCNSVDVGVLALHTLFICLSDLRWYICRDNQDLAIYSLELFSRIVWGDSCAGDLKHEGVRRWLPVHLAVMSRSKRSSKLFEDAALVSRVFGILVDRAGFIEVTPTFSTICCLRSRFDLDFTLHVAGCYVSCVP
jgi:hypothetical protein